VLGELDLFNLCQGLGEFLFQLPILGAKGLQFGSSSILIRLLLYWVVMMVQGRYERGVERMTRVTPFLITGGDRKLMASVIIRKRYWGAKIVRDMSILFLLLYDKFRC